MPQRREVVPEVPRVVPEPRLDAEVPRDIWRARVGPVRGYWNGELIVGVGRELVALQGRAVGLQCFLRFLVEDAVQQYFTLLRSHVGQVEVGLVSRLELRAEGALRRDAGYRGLLGFGGCYGEQCYCGAHGSSSGLPPSAGHHAPALSRFASAKGIGRGAHLPCSLSSNTSPERSVAASF